MKRLLRACVAALMMLGCTAKAPPPPRPKPPTPPALTTLAAGWIRDVEPEPAPAARGLYRRAIVLGQRGDTAGVTALVRQIREQYPESRYAARLEPGASAAATLAAAIAFVATTLAKGSP